MKYILYRVYKSDPVKIFGAFDGLYAAQIAARMLMIENSCFILSSDIKKFYYYTNGDWEYDILNDDAREEFIKKYPNPVDYIKSIENNKT